MYHRVKVGSYPTVVWTDRLNPIGVRGFGVFEEVPFLETLVGSSTKNTTTDIKGNCSPVNMGLLHPAAGKEPGVKGSIT